jgi:hypothetical protein
MATVGELYSFSEEFIENFLVRPVDSVTGDPVQVSVEVTFGAETLNSPSADDHAFYVFGAEPLTVNVTLGPNLDYIIPPGPIEYTYEGGLFLATIELVEIVFSGVVVKFDALPVRPPSVVVAAEDAIFCPCDFRCDFEEKVFADSDNDGIKNDFTDFLFKKITASDTILIELVKDNLVVATITDDTYGTYYNGFDVQPLYVGWLADWTAIFNTFSGGRYRVRVTTTILGAESVSLSRYFRLNTFDILSANNTVKIETFQSGRIANNEFDFTDLVAGGWPSSIRLFGQFGKMQPTLERDTFKDSSYREIQNRDQVIREYALSATLVPESIQNQIAIKDLLANRVLVTSYDVLQGITYEKFPVVPENWNETRYDDLGNTHFEITFSDRQKNIIKTNVS